jgi:hypothetical protein
MKLPMSVPRLKKTFTPVDECCCSSTFNKDRKRLVVTAVTEVAVVAVVTVVTVVSVATVVTDSGDRQ